MVSVSQILIINVVVVIVALILHIVGFATPGWTGNSDVHNGLWQVCTRSGCGNISIKRAGDKLRAVQAMETIALAFYIIAAALGILAVVKLGQRKKANKLMGICVLVAVIFAVIGVIIYGAYNKNYLYYSFGITIVAFIIAIAGGILALWNDRHFTEITS